MEDKIYCPNCGTTNDRGSSFCGSCGEQIESKTQGIHTAEPVTPSQPIPQPTPSTPQYQQQRTTKSEPRFLILGIIGLIIGIISLLVLSWQVWFTSNIWVPLIYFGISVIGFTLSAISIKKGNKGISITGLILSILGGIPQIGAVLFIMLFMY